MAEWFNRIPKPFLALVVIAGAAQIWLSRADPVPELPPHFPEHERPITVTVLEPADFQERLADASTHQGAPTERCRRLGLSALGLVRSIEPPASGVEAGWLQRITGFDPFTSFYLAGTDTVFTLRARSPSIVHEWVHALDDQTSPRMAEAAKAATTDRRLAIRAAIEGTAQALTQTPPPSLPVTANLDRNAWWFAYVAGFDYARPTYRLGDVDAMFRIAPGTSYEVLYGSARRAVEIPQANRPAPSMEHLCSDRLGVVGLLTALKASAAYEGTVRRVVRDWQGDRMDVFSTASGIRHTVWTVAFSDPEALRLWAMGPATLLGAKSEAVEVRGILTDTP